MRRSSWEVLEECGQKTNPGPVCGCTCGERKQGEGSFAWGEEAIICGIMFHLFPLEAVGYYPLEENYCGILLQQHKLFK